MRANGAPSTICNSLFIFASILFSIDIVFLWHICTTLFRMYSDYSFSLFLHDERRQELNETAQWYFVIVASSRHLREFGQTLVGKRKKRRSGFRSMIIFGRTTHRTNAAQNRKRHSQSTCKQHLTATTRNLLVLCAWGGRVYPICARQNKETAAAAAATFILAFYLVLAVIWCYAFLTSTQC